MSSQYKTIDSPCVLLADYMLLDEYTNYSSTRENIEMNFLYEYTLNFKRMEAGLYLIKSSKVLCVVRAYSCSQQGPIDPVIMCEMFAK